jgi:hypothetical protein
MTKARDTANLVATGVPNSLITLDAAEIPNISTDKLTSGTLANARVADLPTSKITSGTFADARISAGSVTQHVTATDLQPLKSDLTALALREATNESSAAFNLPNQFIDTFTDDTNLGTQTDGDRVSGYWTTITTDAAYSTLIHGNEAANTSTSFTDSSPTGHVWTGTNGCTLSTSIKKIGTASMKADGSASELWTTPAHAEYNFGTGTFTIECWVQNDNSYSVGGNNRFLQLGTGTSANDTWGICLTGTGTGWYFWDRSAASGLSERFGGVGHLNTNWNHFAVTRDSSNNIRLFSNGTLSVTDASETQTIGGSSSALNMINQATGDWDVNFNGYVDEVRIMKGTCAYTASFTAPTTAFSAGSSSATGTLIQSANTVASAKTKVGGVMFYKDNAGTATIGTDLKIYFSCNNGGAWTEAASYNAITPVYSTGVKQVRLGETTCTSGTGIIYKAVWANQASGSKDTQLHGIGINY